MAPKKMGLSLYADLLDPDKKSGATISGAPVKYDTARGGDEEAAKKKDASLKFQPIKRPQVQQKNKSKGPSSSSAHKFSSSTATISASSPDKQAYSSVSGQLPNVQKSNFEDWAGDNDDDYYYQDRYLASKKNKKNKKKNQGQPERQWDWDDIYDPSLPNHYADFKGSAEQYRENRDWKARLYYRKIKANKKASSDDEGARARPLNTMFAPPANLNFAPPANDDGAGPPRPYYDDEVDYDTGPINVTGHRSGSDERSMPATVNDMQEDTTGDDAYMRRARMGAEISGHQTLQPSSMVTPASASPTNAQLPNTNLEAKRAEAQLKINALKARIQREKKQREAAALQSSTEATGDVYSLQQSSPPPPPPPPADEQSTTISRAPVRYDTQPTTHNKSSDAEEQSSASEAEKSKSKRPGQKGFAQRLMQKYGWEKGQGLGAQGEGITTALIGKADKRKKLPDSRGGGWSQPANMGKIVGGKRRKVESGDASTENGSEFGSMSHVIKLEGMLKGLDVQQEIEEKNLMQEIGEYMAKDFGIVERVFIWREQIGGADEVFVKFTSQLSALKAVQGMDGTTFADNEVVAKFWDDEKFEREEYV